MICCTSALIWSMLLPPVIAHKGELRVGDFFWRRGNCHIYLNHPEQVDLQLTRAPYPLPKLVIKRKPASSFDYTFDDFEFVNYEAHPSIKAPVAV